MIELRTLGALDLRAPDGRPATLVLAQPKRLALLVYLAIAVPDAFVRRDVLLALFWPDSGEERARGALRQAVRYLRRALGEDTILGRGEEEVGIAPGAVQCDAVALRRALAVGDVAQAAGLYGGELLPGFHLEDTPEFTRWLEDQRTTLRGELTAAAAGAADAAAARGELRVALDWARLAARLQPLDEVVLRRQLTFMDRAGDRAGAVATYQEFTRRLAAELELEPGPETRALGERIARREEAMPEAILPLAPAAPAMRASAAGGHVAPVPMTPPADRPAEPPAPSPVRRRRAAATVGTGLLVLALAGAFVVMMDREVRETEPRLHPQRVLVAPFANRTMDTTLDPVGRMAADWVIEGASRVPALEVVPSTAVWASERQAGQAAQAGRSAAGDAPVDADHLRGLARQTGAGLVVVGSFYRAAARLHFQAQLLDAGTGRVLRPVPAVDVPPDSLLDGIDRLRSHILAALAPVGDTTSHLRMAMPPPTYESYREYLAGMQAFAGGDPMEALRRYDRAAAADATYPMPRLAAAIMYMNLGDLAAADSAAAGVEAMRDLLGPLERSTHDFVLASLRGDQRAAYDAMARASTIAPGTINEYAAAELARRLNRPREALRVLDGLSPERGELRGWRPYWRELGEACHMLGEHRRELADAARARALHPGEPFVLQLEVRALAALGRVRDIEARLVERRDMPDDAVPTAGALMALASHELAAHGHGTEAGRMRDRAIAWYEASRAAATTLRPEHVRLLLHAGRAAAARDLLVAHLAARPTDVAAQGRLAIALARLGDAGAARRLEARLAAELASTAPGRTGPISADWGERSYVRSTVAAQLGDLDRALMLLRQAHAEGLWMGTRLHADPDLEPLRRHPGFVEWLRPKG